MQRSDEKEEINVKIDIVWNEPSQEEVEEFMECASTAGCSGELSSKGSSTFWTAKDKGHSEDGGKWSFDSSISSTSLNYKDLEDKMKGTYALSPDEFEETYGIVKTEPGQYEVYVDPILEGGNKKDKKEGKQRKKERSQRSKARSHESQMNWKNDRWNERTKEEE